MYTLDKDEIDPSLPKEVRAFLEAGGKIEEIRLTETGVWKHEKLEFNNVKIQKAFSKNIKKTEAGHWIIQMGKYTYPIVVEDTGFFVNALVEIEEQSKRNSEGPSILLFLSDDTEEVLNLDTLEYHPEGKLYCSIKGGQYLARFKRPAYYSLLERCEEDENGGIYLSLNGEKRIALI